MLSTIRKIIPKPLFTAYHYVLAVFASLLYGNPSNNMVVIGVTGTSGKSTVVYLISQLLEKAGYRVGAASTIFFKVGKKEKINDKKMTMVGRFALQRLLKQMSQNNCQYAIIETTSQGIEQFRHLPINYDIVLFTNLYPEHIEAHGGFENYKKAKLKLFEKLKTDAPKVIAGQKISKTIIANLDDEHVEDFLQNWAEEKIGFTITGKTHSDIKVISAEDPIADKEGIHFTIGEKQFDCSLMGRHNIYNALAAFCVGLSQGISLEKMKQLFGDICSVPGRLEFIETDENFKVIVDYAFEPVAVKALYETVSVLKPKKIIHILGSTGGGRDKSRRPELGKIAGINADIVIVTNEDPYDEDPELIIDEVAAGALSAGKKLQKDLYKIRDRRQAIKKALKLAKNEYLVLITGKGSEQAIVTKNNTLIPWDDREVIKEELKKLKTG